MPRSEIQKKVWWVLYLITTQSVFALPDPVFPKSPVYIPPKSGRSNNGKTTSGTTTSTASATTEPTGGTTGGEEPMVAASSLISASDNLNIAEASSYNRGPRSRPPRPPRRHPPPIKAVIPPPPHMALILKQSKLTKPKKPYNFQSVPKKTQKPRHQHNSDAASAEFNRRPSLKDLILEDPPMSSIEPKSMELHSSKYSSSSASRDRYQSKERGRDSNRYRSKERERDPNRSFIRDEYYSGGGSGGDSYSVEEKSPAPPPPPPSRPPPPPPPPPKPGRNPDDHHHPIPQTYPSSSAYHDDGPAPFPKPARPVKLSYYYDSNDKHDLKTLITSHHLKRRGKECDGLENFIYDLEVIAFLMGVVSAIIGMYSDVIPFFNDGVKISYSNNYGDGQDFPHEYWNNHDAKIDAVVSKRHGYHHLLRQDESRTISIGTSQDNIKEVVSVAGEFISLVSLGISFLGLFPHLVEKFFFILDWWFGKRGLWKQYLYTYKCEIHPYPNQGWGWGSGSSNQAVVY